MRLASPQSNAQVLVRVNEGADFRLMDIEIRDRSTGLSILSLPALGVSVMPSTRYRTRVVKAVKVCASEEIDAGSITESHTIFGRLWGAGCRLQYICGEAADTVGGLQRSN